MPFTKKEHMKISKKDYTYFILGADVGGTNTNLGIFGIKNRFPTLLASLHFKSKELRWLHNAINETLNYMQKNYKISITKACIAAAGVLSHKKDYVKTQNLPWDISKKELLKKTKLKKILIVNDFEAIGYSINMLSKNDVAVIKKAKRIPKAPIAVIGAGTGLGKTTLIYSEQYKSYKTLPSEAGHTDFAAQSQEELDLINFVRKSHGIKQSISYEQLLSGQGLENIYLFLRKSGKFKEIRYINDINNNFKPELISKYRKIDATCKETFRIFKIIYAKFARNTAIDSLSFGGVYIAGGIAPKNKDIFDKEFIRIFEDNHKMKNVLRKIPIFLVVNNNVGLLGAGFLGAKVLK